MYAQNDHFFGPGLAQRFLAAFGGNQVQFVALSPFGTDGHSLFSQAGIPIWTPLVDDFLQSRNLRLLAAPLPRPLPPSLRPPSGLSENGLHNWNTYLASPPHKAFALSPGGRCGWRSSRRNTDDAQSGALGNCAIADCKVVAVDNALLPAFSASASTSAPRR